MSKPKPRKSFDWIYRQAVARFSSADDLEASLPKPKSPRALQAVSDADYLSLITRRVFRAGLSHKMVDAKWQAFEKACKGFQPKAMAALSDEGLEAIMQTDGIIRHWGKLKSIRVNAQLVCDVAVEHESFGKWLAAWPADDIVTLWLTLKRRGAHLGGHSAPRFLRMAGVDTFLLTDDTVAVLSSLGYIDREPRSKTALLEVQDIFNQWASQSGRPLCQVSRIVSHLAG